MINGTGIITTIAGTGTEGDSGDGGAATSAQLHWPYGVALDNRMVYIADFANNKVRMVSSTGIITTFAGTGAWGDGGDGGAATSALLNNPFDVAVDISGNVYIADSYNGKIRLVKSNGIISTLATNMPSFGIAVDNNGNVYATVSQKILIINSAGIITTFAGTGGQGSSGDGEAATSALLHNPEGVAVDISGNVYIADSSNNKIRMVNSAGIITTIAGTGTQGITGDGNAATSAHLNFPTGVAVDLSGNVYIADTYNNKIRLVFPRNQPTIQPTSQVNQKRHHFTYL